LIDEVQGTSVYCNEAEYYGIVVRIQIGGKEEEKKKDQF